jgi:amino acid permease
VCSYTGARTYRDAWSKSVGDDSSWIPAVTVTFETSFLVMSYSMILADTVRGLLMGAGYGVSRTAALLGITCTTLLPLCMVKNLSGLAPFSLVGVAGMFYTAFAMAARYLGGSYAIAKPIATKGKKVAAIATGGGMYVADVSANLRPTFGNVGAYGALSPNVFILVCLLSTAYSAHYNAPKFYVELKNNTLRRYNAVVASSFGISVLLFASIGSLGFLTFGKACSGLILNNYSGKDALMGLSRLAVAVSIVFSFPLVFAGARDGWLDLLKVPVDDRTGAVLTTTTVAVLSGITLLASRLRELAFIMSFSGATMGNALIYVYPALMFRGAVKGMGEKADKGLRREVPFAMFTALLGVAMGGIGAKMALGLL